MSATASANTDSTKEYMALPKLRYGERGPGNPKHLFKRLMGEYLLGTFGPIGRWWETGKFTDPTTPTIADFKAQLKAMRVTCTEAECKDLFMKQVTQALNERSKLEDGKAKMYARVMTALAPEANEIVRADHRFAEAFQSSDLTTLYRIVMAVHGAGDSSDLRYAGECARERYQALIMRPGQSVYDFIAEEAEAYENLGATG
jgi:hypothetical protein